MLLLNVLLLVANGFASRLMTALALFCTKLPFRRGGKVIFPVFIAAMVAFPSLFQIRMGVDFYGWEGLKAGGLSLAFILTLFVAMAGNARKGAEGKMKREQGGAVQDIFLQFRTKLLRFFKSVLYCLRR